VSMRRREFFRKAWKGLIVGQILPALVLLGIWLGLEVGRRHLMAYAFALMLAGGLLGMIIGLFIVAAALKRLYPAKSR
jgi:hypothetical protein